MTLDLSILKRFFYGFYNVILAFLLVTALLLVHSYFDNLTTLENHVHDLQQDIQILIAQDLKAADYKIDDPYKFYQKYSSVNLHLINNILVVNASNEAFFTSNTEKKYRYEGIQKNGDVNLGTLILKNNIFSTNRLENGTEIIILSSKVMVKDLVIKEWVSKNLLQFGVSILVPVLLLMGLMLMEERIIKDLEIKFRGYFDALKGKDLEKDELYKGLYYNNRSVMILIDPKTGLVVDGNESALSYYGYRFREQEIKIGEINTLPLEEINQIMADAIEKKRNYFVFQHRLKNGMIRDVEVYSGPVVMEGREVLCSIVHDVTDKVRAEQNLLSQQVEMERKIQEKSEILATISHEIKTPIAGIIHNVNDLASKMNSPETQRQLQFLKLNINNLNRLVFDLLDYSRLDAGGFKFYSGQFDLLEVLETSIQLFKPVAVEKKINLSINKEGLRRHLFVGDAFRIGQIVNNLISNSVKYTNRGMINIKVSDEVMDHQSLVTIVIEDTGIGMKPEVVEQIFKRFYTTDYSGKMGGTGLGLAICRLIVEAMDGTLEVESKEGIGTKMTLVLELENDEGADLSLMNLSDVSVYRQGINVLLVDDDPMSSLFIEKMLKQVNFLEVKVDNAYNGKEAIEMLDAKAYQCIICDYRLPDILGTEVLNKAKNYYDPSGQMRTILMSADYLNEKNNAADEFWLKPIEANKLEKTLRKLFVEVGDKNNPLSLEKNEYLSIKALDELVGYVGEEELKSVLNLFLSAMLDKQKQLPETLAMENLEDVNKVIHSIKGSISYLKSETFIAKLSDLERDLLNVTDIDKSNQRYQHFCKEFHRFIDEAGLMVKYVDTWGKTK